MDMFNNFLGNLPFNQEKKQKQGFHKFVIKLEFLSHEQKQKKDQNVQKLKQKMQQEEQKEQDLEMVIFPDFESVYQVDFRQQITFPLNQDASSFAEIKKFFIFQKNHAQIIQSEYQNLADFYYQYVNRYELYLQGKKIKENQVFQLVCDQADDKIQIPVLEVVYWKNSKLKQFTRKTAIAAKKITKKIWEFLSLKWLKRWLYYSIQGKSLRAVYKLYGPQMYNYVLRNFVPMYAAVTDGIQYADVAKDFIFYKDYSNYDDKNNKNW